VRIGILAPVAWRVPPRHYGGWENVCHLLADGLVRRGHDVTLFASGDSITSARLESVVPRPLEEDASLAPRVWETLHITHACEQAGALDVLHNNAGVWGTVLSRLAPVPVLTTLHGSAAEEESRIAYARYAEQSYVSISDAERRLAPELNYVATVYNGIAPPEAPVEAPDDYLLYLGRISPDKGVHHAIDAACASGRTLLLAGIVPASDREYFRERIEPRTDGDRVRFVGETTAAERDALMRRAAGFLHLIEYEEAFGLTMAEAMANGAPVIAFPRGSVPEVVRDGETGFIVRSTEEAAAAVDRLGAISRERCAAWARERFSAARMVEGYERVYDTLVRKDGARAGTH
jgi:glycosyltransferase involved in cell wall biosynthesis